MNETSIGINLLENLSTSQQNTAYLKEQTLSSINNGEISIDSSIIQGQILPIYVLINKAKNNY